MGNPYDPQRPSPPESFAGRAKLIHRIQDALNAARLRRASTAILVHGHRASGKTSALRKIQAMTLAAGPGAIALEIPLRQKSSDATLLETIVEELTSEVRTRKAGDELRWSGALDRLRAVSVQVSSPVGGAGISIERAPPAAAPPAGAFARWREALAALGEASVLALCIDDAEFLDGSGVGTLKTIAEARLPVPVLLAVSAGPELVDRLASRDYSPVARAFSGATFDMEDFTLPETREALASPLRDGATGAWSDGAVLRIHELSHGNPYLVKCLANAAYRDAKTLTERDVEGAVREALHIASPWLSREISKAADGDIKAFAKIARARNPSMRNRDIVALGINSVYIGRLVKLGVLKKKGPSHYELRKAPVIAYFHELERGIGGGDA